MALPLKRTLAEIRSDIQIRLGFGMSGQAGIVNSPLIDSMIRDAQEQLYLQYDFIELRGVFEKSTGATQIYYDYPANCNAERITNFSVKWSGRYIPLEEGISVQDRNMTAGGRPQRYELRDQIEVWPAPESVDYILRFEYIRTLLPLFANSDRTSIPSELVLLHALTNAKLHYGDADADKYSSQLDAALVKLKQRQRRTVFGKNTTIDPYSFVTSDQRK